MIKEITVPEIGEKVESGKVVGVLVSKGDMVDVDDGIIEFETEKAVVEIPSPEKGKITEILVSEGDELKIGDVVAKLDTEGEGGDDEEEDKGKDEADEKEAEEEETEEASDDESDEEESEEEESEEEEPREKESEKKKPRKKQEDKPAAKEKKAEKAKPSKEAPRKQGPAPASPSVRRLARELGVDIYAVEGSGPGGRITDSDVKDHVKTKDKSAAPTGKSAPTAEATSGDLPDFSRWGEVEAMDLSTVRRITAESMAVAWRTIPHVTQFDKADITELNEWMKKAGKQVEKAGGKLTVTAVIMKVIAEALGNFPRFNASIDLENEQLILKKYVHLGMAVDTERGLLVPVIRDVDQKSITDLAVEIMDLAERTRNKKVKPDELEGGTFTISNQGGIGGTNFTPIVYWPQAAILGISRSSVEPKYVDGEVRPRTILPLSLSYDHRIVDGADAARFLRWVCDALENAFTLHLD